MHKVSHNIICACCGIIRHNVDDFAMLPANDIIIFAPLTVNPDEVPFSFNCGIAVLDKHHIIIDPLTVKDQETLSVCQKCHSCLSDDFFPIEAMANFHWIGPIPEDLTWAEEALIARSHLFGRRSNLLKLI